MHFFTQKERLIKEHKGCTQAYVGNGKGKTTAALGLILRSRGHGLKACLIQFIKSSRFYGEINSLKLLDVDLFQYGRLCPYDTLIAQGDMTCAGCGECFISVDNITDKDRATIFQGYNRAKAMLASGNYFIVVLDEVLDAVDVGLLSNEDVKTLVNEKAEQTELVLTGRKVKPDLEEYIDLVTDMNCIKHPFEKGISARRGIEY